MPFTGYSIVISNAPFLSSVTMQDLQSAKAPSPLFVKAVSVGAYKSGYEIIASTTSVLL